MTVAWSWLLLAAEALALAVVGPRLVRAARGGRRLRRPASTQAPPRISVVVPARNEAGRLGDCLAPLRDAPGVVEVIVVDDESTDSTAEVARAHGAKVVAGAALPDGWVGKIWALDQGISAASGDVIVTLDADTRPDPVLPLAAAETLERSGAELATVAPRFRSPSPAGTWLHAAMLTSLVYRHGAGSGRATRRSVGNGQCMVFRRDDASSGGWCARVRDSTVEDVALVRALVRDGAAVEMFDGSELLAVRMFEGFGDTWRGWGRSLALAGVETRARQAFDLMVVGLTLVSPPMLVAAGAATPLTVVLLAVRLGTLVGTRRAYERRGFAYWASPAADLLAWVAVARGASAKSHHWRGRTYR